MSTVYHTRKLNLVLSEDDQFAQALFLRSEKVQSISDSLTEFASAKLKIADTDGAVAVPFAGVETARCLYIEADGDCDVTLDESATPIKLRPPDQKMAVLMLEAIEATSVSITNPTASSTITALAVVAGV